MKSEVIVHRHGRVEYDFAVRQVGVTFVEIGDANDTAPVQQSLFPEPLVPEIQK